MAYFRTFEKSTVESYKEPESTDCTDCGSDRTSYIYCAGGKEIRKCHDCNNYFEVEEE